MFIKLISLKKFIKVLTNISCKKRKSLTDVIGRIRFICKSKVFILSMFAKKVCHFLVTIHETISGEQLDRNDHSVRNTEPISSPWDIRD